MLAEALRSYLAANAPLPVSGSAFNLDALLTGAPSMSLRMTESEPVRTYIDGSKVMRQAFTIFYRAAKTSSNTDKSAMLGALNGIGTWMGKLMKSQEKPYLADWLTVIQFEQVKLANIDIEAEAKDSTNITYLAEYVLGYQTK